MGIDKFQVSGARFFALLFDEAEDSPFLVPPGFTNVGVKKKTWPGAPKIYFYSSSWPVFLYLWHMNNRMLVLQTLHRGQRYARMCPFLVNCDTLYPLLLPHIPGLPSCHITPPPYLSLQPISFQLWRHLYLTLYPENSITICSQHRITIRSSWFLSSALYMYRIDRVVIYRADIFWLRQM